MKRVLVTGASGFIGLPCLSWLVELGYDVTALSRAAPAGPVTGVDWIQADLSDATALEDAMRSIRPSHLLHLAWYAEHGKFWRSAENLRCVQQSISLMECFARHGGARMVTAGTCAEYDWRWGYCVEDQTPLEPATLYGTCKNAVREIQAGFCALNGISQAWGRAFLLYGPRENPSRLVASVISALIEGRPARCSHGRQLRDIMHVGDVAGALAALLDSDAEGQVNIASGRPVAVKDVIGTLAAQIGRPELVQLGALPAPADDPPLLCASADRLHREVGWADRFDLATGLADTIAWWRSQVATRGSEGVAVV